MSGDNRNPSFRRLGRGRSGKYRDSNGYIQVYSPNHPYAHRNGCVVEHRLVMEEKLGRYLLPSETVHHKGMRYSDIRNRSDNLEDNLELRIGQHGKGIAVMRVNGELRNEIEELQKQVSLLKWQIKYLNQTHDRVEAPDWF